MYSFSTPLCKIAYKYGTDKCPQINHNYTEFYFEIFKNKRYKVRTVVEIGIGWGSSLFMWREFFPKAIIYGADINTDLLFKTDRIKTFFCDQRKTSDLKKLIKKVGKDIDLFVDDGSHKPEDQVFTCKTVMPQLSKKTIYVIEDVAHKEIADQLGMYDLQFKRKRKMSSNNDRLLIVMHKK